MVANVELRMQVLADDNNLNFVYAFDCVLPQDVGDVVVWGTHCFHVVAHVKEEIISWWILHLESLEVVIDII